MPAELSLARGCGNAALLDLAQRDNAGWAMPRLSISFEPLRIPRRA
jgi:hypothetical protein